MEETVHFREDALQDFVVGEEYWWYVMDFVTMSKIQQNATGAGDFITQLTEIRFATAPSGNILSLTLTTTAFHCSPKVFIQWLDESTRYITENDNKSTFFHYDLHKGPCQNRYVVTIAEQGRLGCAPTQCESIDNDNLSRQLVPANDGVCYALGSRGSCATTSQFLGYDIFKHRVQCVDFLDPSSPYFSWPAQDDFLGSIYNQLHPEYDEFRVSFVYESLTGKNETEQRRQGANTVGAVQFPGTTIESLLHPCRTGARRGINFKCTNPLM